MTVFQLLALRSIAECIISLVLMNVRTKHILITSVESRHFKNLFMRCALGIVTYFGAFYSLKYLPLILASSVMSLTPVVTAILSYFILKEIINRFECMVLIVSLAGVIVMILGQAAPVEDLNSAVNIGEYQN